MPICLSREPRSIRKRRSENLNTERVESSGRSRSRPRKRMAQRRPVF
nr:MAG TPA: hypothetical protein [Caudoviricetes sp.]